MTTKKKGSTTRGRKGTAAGRAEALKARARAIIDDERDYDYDTRRALARALEDKRLRRDHLAEMIAQAEAGELVEHPIDDCVEEDYRGTAHHAIQFLNLGLPDWLLQATMWVIDAVAEVHHINIRPDNEAGNLSARALGDLFRVSGLYQFDDLPNLTLAEHVSIVLNHPDTPPGIRKALADVVACLTGSEEVRHHSDVIAVALAQLAKEEGGGSR